MGTSSATSVVPGGTAHMFVITQINSPSTTSSGVDAAVLCLAAHAVMLAATSLNLTAISVVKIPATD